MLERIRDSILFYHDRKAFIIKDQVYNYHDFAGYITGIRQLLRNFKNIRNKIVAIYTDDTIDTYAAIYAVWFEGLTFLPLNARFPVTRNREIMEQTGANTLLYAGIEVPDDIMGLASNMASVKGVYSGMVDLKFTTAKDDDILYILFTSGSTGIPKGVPVSLRNLDSFIGAFLKNKYTWNADDRFLQMFDFTFDVSVQCYTVPLLLGACICTVPNDQIKYLAVYKVLEKHHITVAIMVPSVIAFLKPYMKNICLPEIRNTIFTGEAVPHSLVEEWAQCCPHSAIDDCYGPTEATIYCLSYRWSKDKGRNKSYQGIVSIGLPFDGIVALIMSEKDEPVPPGVKGELFLAGNQVTKGYLNNAERNSVSFVELTHNNKQYIFYRTGDLVFIDEYGDFMYCGRMDNQVQIQGFRVEMGEIEYHAKQIVKSGNCVAVAKPNKSGIMEIFLFIEDSQEKIPGLIIYLQSALPYYMQPLKVISIDAIPLNDNSKTDRNQLISMIE